MVFKWVNFCHETRTLHWQICHDTETLIRKLWNLHKYTFNKVLPGHYPVTYLDIFLEYRFQQGISGQEPK